MKNIILLTLLAYQVFTFAQRGDYKPDKPAPSTTKSSGTSTPKPPAKSKPAVTVADKNTVTLTILPAMAACPGNPTQQCYQIKKHGSDAIEYVDDIEKLPNYDFGYTYTIQAKQKEKEVYIEGQSPYKYIWVKTLTKTEEASNYIDNTAQINTSQNINTTNDNGKIVGVSNINTNSPIDGIWYLRKMKEKEGSSIITDDNVMWIDINTFKDYLSGFGACNKFEATLRSDLNTKFTVSKITPTYYSCGNEVVEKLFFSLLDQTNKFEIKNGNLILSNQWNFLLGFTKDKDNKEDIPVTYTPDKIIQNEQQTYATDGNLKNKPVSDLPNQYKHTEYSEVTTTQKNDEAPKTTIVQSSVPPSNTNISDKDKKIADLQKQLDDIKKAKEEEQKQQLLKQQQEAQEKEKVAAALKQQQEELEKEKKIAALQLKKETEKKKQEEEIKYKAEINSEKSTSKNSSAINNNTDDNKNQVKKTEEIKNVINFSNVNVAEPDFNYDMNLINENSIIGKVEKKVIPDLDLFSASIINIKVDGNKSSTRINENAIPYLFIVKVDNNSKNPLDIIKILKLETGRKERKCYISNSLGVLNEGNNSNIPFKAIKYKDNSYLIAVENKLESGEYVITYKLQGCYSVNLFGIDN